MSVLAKLAAVVSTRAAVGLAAAVLALAAAGAATEVALGATVNPENWGQQVVQQVQKCKLALASGERGIGDCVSDFASQHGQQVSAEHRASDARTNKIDVANGTPAGQNSGRQNNHGRGSSKTDHPGRPSNHPGKS
jgi:hypothetical protein